MPAEDEAAAPAEETKAEAEAVAEEAPAETPGDDTAAETGEAEKPVEAPEPAPETASGGRGRLIAAGIAGLLIVGAVGGGWLYRDYGARIFGAPEVPGMAELQSRLAALETSTKANAQQLIDLKQAVSVVDNQLAGVEQQLTTQRAGLADVAAIKTSVEELRSALSAASSSGAGDAAGQAANKLAIDELSQELSSLEGRIGEAETAAKAAAGAADKAAVMALEEKLAGLDQALADLKAEQERLATQGASQLGRAFATLTNRVAGNQPFGEALDALTAEAPDVPGVEVLRPLAATGVPTTADLASELDEIAKGLEKPEETAGPESSGGIMGALKSKLSSVVKVRRIDEADWPAVLAKAAGMVRGGDIDAAVALIDGQPGSQPEALTAWRAKAGKRIAANAALDKISRAVLGRLAAGGQSG